MYEVHKGIAYLLIFGQYNCHVEGEECVIYTMTVRADWQTEQNWNPTHAISCTEYNHPPNLLDSPPAKN